MFTDTKNIDETLDQYKDKIIRILNVPVKIGELLVKHGYQLPSASLLNQQKSLLTGISQGNYATTGVLQKLIILLNEIFELLIPLDEISAKKLKLYLYANTIKSITLRNKLFSLIQSDYEFTAHQLPTDQRTCDWIRTVNQCFEKRNFTTQNQLEKVLTQLRVTTQSGEKIGSDKWNPSTLAIDIVKKEKEHAKELKAEKTKLGVTIKKTLQKYIEILLDLYRNGSLSRKDDSSC